MIFTLESFCSIVSFIYGVGEIVFILYETNRKDSRPFCRCATNSIARKKEEKEMGSKKMKRLLLSALSSCMLFTQLVTTPVLAEEPVDPSLTDTEIIINNYGSELTDQELAILESENIVQGTSHSYVVPTNDDELITSDGEIAQFKTYTDKYGNVWVPTSPVLEEEVGGSLKTTPLSLTEVTGGFEAEINPETNAYTIKVDYVSQVEVDKNFQELRLNTPHLLAEGVRAVEFVKAVSDESSDKLNALNQIVLDQKSYIGWLQYLIEVGVATPLGQLTFSPGEHVKQIIKELADEETANAGKFDLVVLTENYINEYSSDKKDLYLLTDGKANNYFSEAEKIHDKLQTIAYEMGDGTVGNGTILEFARDLETFSKLASGDQKEQLEMFITALEKIDTAIKEAEQSLKPIFDMTNRTAAIATHASNPLVNGFSSSASNLIAAGVGNTVGNYTAKPEALVLSKTTLTYSADRYDVEFAVVIKTVGENNAIEEVYRGGFTDAYNEGTARDYFDNLFGPKDTELVNQFNTAHPEYGLNTTNYVRNVSFSLEAGDPNGLVGPLTYVVTYTPAMVDVTLDGFSSDEIPAQVPYRYVLNFPDYVNNCDPVADDKCVLKSYEYQINGVNYSQDDTFTVTEKITITRSEGKSKDRGDFYHLVSEDIHNGLTENAREILKSAALKNELTYEYRIPGNADVSTTAGSGKVVITLGMDGGVYKLNAGTYSAGVEDMVWVPVSYSTVGGTASGSITNGYAEFTDPGITGVDVKYQLVVKHRDNSGNSEVTTALLNKILNLPHDLSSSAKSQITGLTNISSQYSNLSMGSAIQFILTDLLTKETDPDAIAAMNNLLDNCFTGTTLKLFTLVDEIVDKTYDQNNVVTSSKINNINALKNYYLKSNEYQDQVKYLIDNLPAILECDSFKQLMTNPTYAEQQSKIDNLLSTLKNRVYSYLTDPMTEDVDINHGSVGALFEYALSATTAPVSVTSETVLLDEVSLRQSVDGYTSVTVEVKVGTTTKTDSVSLYMGTWTADKIQMVKDAIAALEAEMTSVDFDFYSEPATIENMPELDSVLDDTDKENVIKKVWVEKEVAVENSVMDAQTVSISKKTINFPSNPTKGNRYVFSVNGKTFTTEYGTTASYTLTDDEVKAALTAGKLVVTHEELSLSAINIKNLVNALDASVATYDTGFTLVEKDDEFAVVLNISTNELKQMKDILKSVVQELALQAEYDFIALEDNSSDTALMEIGSKGARIVSIQGIVNALVNNNGVSLDEIIDMIDENSGVIANKLGTQLSTDGYTVVSNGGSLANLGTSLVESNIYLGSAPVNAIGYPFYVSLSTSNDASANVDMRKNMVKANAMLDFDIANDRMNVGLTLKDRMYQMLLAGMLITEYTTLDDVTDVDTLNMFNYLEEQVRPMIPDMSAAVIKNTLTKAKVNFDVNQYAAMIDKLLGYVKPIAPYSTFSDEVETTDGKGVQATLSIEAENLLKTIVDENLLGMLKETTIKLPIELAIDNIGTSYEAAVFDNSKAGVDKVAFVSNLASVSEGLGENSMVVLLSDVADIKVTKPVMIDLNGHNVNKLTYEGTTGTTKLFNGNLKKIGTVATLSGDNFAVAGGNYNVNLTDEQLVDGYKQDEGKNVVSQYYTITLDQNDNVTLNIDSGYLASAVDAQLKYIGVDLALKLGLKYYTTAEFTVDGNTIYSTNYTDLIDTYGSADSKTGLLNIILDDILKYDAASKFANQLIEDLTDFAAIKTALENDEPVAVYNMQLKDWDIDFSVVNGEYVTASVAGENSVDRTLTVKVTGDNKDHLVELFDELSKVVTEIKGTVELTDIDINGKTVEAEYSGEFTGKLDFTNDDRYTSLLGIILSYTHASMVDATEAYINDGDEDAFITAFNKLSVAQVITAVKNAGGKSFATLTSKVTVPSISYMEKVKELEGLYHNYLELLDKALTKYEVDGTSGKLAGSYNDVTGEHTFDNSLKGIDFNGSVKLFAPKDANPKLVITDQPDSVTVDYNGNAEFVVAATGEGTISYQWYKDGTELTGETNATLSLTALKCADSGAKFTVVVSSTTGEEVPSNEAILTVNHLVDSDNKWEQDANDHYKTYDCGCEYDRDEHADPDFDGKCNVCDYPMNVDAPTVTNPVDTTAVNGEATFTVTGSGNGTLTYQWYKDGVAMTGETNATLTLTGLKCADNGSKYHVVVTNAANLQATSTAATLTVGHDADSDGALEHNANGHYKTYDCGHKYDEASHADNDGWNKDTTNHWHECECGYEFDKAPHKDPNEDGKCDVCEQTGLPINLKITKQPVNVTADNGKEVEFSVEAKGEGTLSYEWYAGTTKLNVNEPTLKFIASCDLTGTSIYVIVSDDNGKVSSDVVTLTVNHVFAEEWSFDGEHHWHDCGCGAMVGLEDHVDADEDGDCDVCGTYYEHLRVQVYLEFLEKFISEDMKEAGLTTVEKVKAAMLKGIQEKVAGANEKNTLIVEAQLEFLSLTNKAWEEAGEEHWPTDMLGNPLSLKVTLPYPEGTNKDDYKFLVAHMFSENMDGNKAGTFEYFTPTKTDEGLVVYVSGLSPFIIYYEKIVTSEPSIVIPDTSVKGIEYAGLISALEKASLIKGEGELWNKLLTAMNNATELLSSDNQLAVDAATEELNDLIAEMNLTQTAVVAPNYNMYLLAFAMLMVTLLALVAIYNKKRNLSLDNTPVVDYNISDDDRN